MTDIMTPTLGESVTEATVARWTKKAGDPVKRDEILVELETDKVSLEVAAPEDGVLSAIDAAEGATVLPGQRLGQVASAAGAPTAPEAKPAAARSPSPAPVAAAARPRRRRQSAAAMPLAPSVQRIVAENKLDPATIAGTGQDGRITKGDALAAIDALAARPAAGAHADPRSATVAVAVAHEREERVRMSRLRQTIARRLKEAQANAAMLTTFNEVDMSAVMALRNQYKDAFREAPRRQARLHELLREGLRLRPEGGAGGQRRDRRRGPDLQESLRHRRGRRHRTRAGGAGGARRRRAQPRRRSSARSAPSARRPATAPWPWRTCRAAPSPSPTAGSTAR